MPDTNQTQSNVIWLASYPKCGSTWLREILNSAISPDDDRNRSIPSFQKAYPEDPPIYMLMGQPTRLVKTHLYPDHPRMEACPDRTIAAITIRRHPLDILLSALNHAYVRKVDHIFLNGVIKPVEEIIRDGEYAHYVEQFRETDGFIWFAGPCGALSAYMKRWRSLAPDTPYYEVCYEDLFANPEEEIRKVLAFLDLDLGDEAIERIRETADQRTAQNGRFFWKRRSYNFQAILSPDLIDLFHDRCATQLAALGYPLSL